ncbi:MAG: hypothetical protein L3K08_03580 [Thermoplasmata archaeon]|nr:hypothetical protein [Thermoplasmata archaeon]
MAAGVVFTLLGPVHVAVPPAGILLLLGAGSLSISLLTTALRIRLEEDWAAAHAQTGPAAPGAPTCPACAEPAESHHAAHTILRQIEVWSLLRRRGSSAAFASTTGATPSDFIWSSWATAGTALPVDLVGPVPETAYVVPAPGAIDHFPEHGVPMLPPSALEDLPSGPQRYPDPGTRSAPTFTGAPSLSDGAAAWSPRASGSPYRGGMASRSGAFAGFDMSGPAGSAGPGPLATEVPFEAPGMNWIQREALTATPPHLRPLPAAPKVPEPPRPAAPPVSGPPVCATCAQRIQSPAVWRRCPDCYRPICPDCIVTALLEQDRGWCESCAEARIESERSIAS